MNDRNWRKQPFINGLDSTAKCNGELKLSVVEAKQLTRLAAENYRYEAKDCVSLGGYMTGKYLAAVFLLILAVAFVSAQDTAQSQAAPSSATGAQLKQVAYLKASNAEAYDHFGCGGASAGHTGNSLAISRDGSTMAIGAPYESSGARGLNGDQNDNSVYGSGAVYVFTRQGDTWAQQAYVKASNTGLGDHFGSSVVLSGDGNTLAVAAHFESSAATGVGGDQSDDSIPQAGAVYVFARAGNSWSQRAYIKASNTGRAGIGDEFGDGDQFGYSLALSAAGDMLAVGAITEDSGAQSIGENQDDDSQISSGAVYVFTRTGETWSQRAYLKASNSEAGDLFGFAVALSADGNTLAASSYDEDGGTRLINGPDDNRRTASGAIFVFDRNGDTWSQTAYLKGSKSERTDQLGYALAISDDGNTIAGGAGDEDCLIPGVNPPGCDNDSPADIGANIWVGAAYVFVRRGNSWTEQAFIKASNPRPYNSYGVRLALSGDGNTFAVTAYLEDEAAQGIHGPEPVPFLIVPNLDPWRANDNQAVESGAVYLYTRTDDDWIQQAYVKASNAQLGDEFGSAIALSGDGSTMVVAAHNEDSSARDVNGDQADDLASESGAVYVFTY